MHPLLRAVWVAGLLAVASGARADTIDDFHLSLTNGQVFTFALSSAVNGHADAGHGEALYDDVAVSLNGVAQTAVQNGVEFENGNYLRLTYGPYTFRNLYVAAFTFPQVFLSVGQDPVTMADTVTFTPGSYTAAPIGTEPGATLMITPEGTASAVPEPESLALLGTGAVGLVGAWRRRSVG